MDELSGRGEGEAAGTADPLTEALVTDVRSLIERLRLPPERKAPIPPAPPAHTELEAPWRAREEELLKKVDEARETYRAALEAERDKTRAAVRAELERYNAAYLAQERQTLADELAASDAEYERRLAALRADNDRRIDLIVSRGRREREETVKALEAEAGRRAAEAVAQERARAGALAEEEQKRAAALLEEARRGFAEERAALEAAAASRLAEAVAAEQQRAAALVEEERKLAAARLEEERSRGAALLDEERRRAAQERAAAVPAAPPQEIPSVPFEAPAAPEAPLEPPREWLAVPGLDPLLEPNLLKVSACLEEMLARAHAHVRRIGGQRLPEGTKALLRMGSSEIAQARDRLRVLALLFDDGRPLEDLRLQPVVDSVLASWEPALRARGVSLIRRAGGEAVRCRADSESIRAALFELVKNSFEAMPRGGKVSVSVRVDGGAVLLAVVDSGPGFSPEALACAFTPFAMARQGRLGLGLALAQRAARRAGGDAEAENPAQGGARVVLRLPLSGIEAPNLSA